MKTLKKKQREVTQKHQKNETDIPSAAGSSIPRKDSTGKVSSKKQSLKNNEASKHSFSDDSDLASLAREFEEEDLVKESPFIRKVNIEETLVV